MVCSNPIRIRNPNWMQSQFEQSDQWLSVPCGKCIACRIQRTREWSERLLAESFNWNVSCFVTVTYNDDYLPYSNSNVPTLVKKHLQDYIKRIRRDLEYYQKRKIKYYACGEYGDLNHRPHYHIIFFGLDAEKDLELLESKWSYGFVKAGSVTYESCQYVAGYVQKKLYIKAGEKSPDFLPQFSLQSMGLGKQFYLDNHETFELGGSVPVGNGRRIRRSRYSDKVLGLTTEEKYALSICNNSSDDFWRDKVEPYFVLHTIDDFEYVDYVSEEDLIEFKKFYARKQNDLNLSKRFNARNKGNL